MEPKGVIELIDGAGAHLAHLVQHTLGMPFTEKQKFQLAANLLIARSRIVCFRVLQLPKSEPICQYARASRIASTCPRPTASIIWPPLPRNRQLRGVPL